MKCPDRWLDDGRLSVLVEGRRPGAGGQEPPLATLHPGEISH
jgi:hypothetical protein